MTPGLTPLLSVSGIFAKLECTNPTGSVKDRIAKYILDESEKRGLLRPGMRIVEATSGNTGISMSFYAREKGYPITIVMPENMTEERKEIIRKFGAELVLCRAGDFAEAARVRDEMCKDPNCFNPDQFSNPLNVECHLRTTGQEILSQMEDREKRVHAFVAGVGTGGTLIGVGKAIKEKFPNAWIAALEPAESAVMSGGKSNPHIIYGIGDGFIPAIAQGSRNGLHPLIDEVITVPGEESRVAALHIQEEHGFCVGISSGANFLAAQKLRKRFENVVTIFSDGYSKYKSQGLAHCADGQCPYEEKKPIELS